MMEVKLEVNNKRFETIEEAFAEQCCLAKAVGQKFPIYEVVLRIIDGRLIEVISKNEQEVIISYHSKDEV